MAVKRLVLNNFRNITNTDIEPSIKINFISGENGSGKTSILESLSTIAHGRSFRTRKYKNIIQYNHVNFTLFCEFEINGLTHKTGISRSLNGSSVFKLNDKPVLNALELANVMPLQVINATSFDLLSGSSVDRRRFLDWIVFHVKHSFQSDWREYMRCLKQRNAILRSGRIDNSVLNSWNLELAQLCERIDQNREQSIIDFIDIFNRYCSEFDFIDKGVFSIDYKRGWSNEYASYYQCLIENRDRDQKLGYTSLGAHKSDIAIKFNKKPVSELYSRGQLKSLIAALYMAQIELFVKTKNSPCLLLIDDLPAELDDKNLNLVAGWISNLENVQVFITGVHLIDLIRLWPKQHVEQGKLFHVKHGKITEQPMYAE
jgi:DNA replication and repair protein RecF